MKAWIGVPALLAMSTAHAVEYRTVLPAQSRIGFEFVQMGVKVPGSFRRFSAQMAFDPAKPAVARARLDVDLASIDTGSPEADDESAGKLWFDRAAFPVARFDSTEVRALGGNRYEMRGFLTIKGKRRETSVPVAYTPGRGAARFDGSFIIRRLDFGIGEGMWADVGTVANDVKVSFSIAATGQ